MGGIRKRSMGSKKTKKISCATFKPLSNLKLGLAGKPGKPESQVGKPESWWESGEESNFLRNKKWQNNANYITITIKIYCLPGLRCRVQILTSASLKKNINLYLAGLPSLVNLKKIYIKFMFFVKKMV